MEKTEYIVDEVIHGNLEKTMKTLVYNATLQDVKRGWVEVEYGIFVATEEETDASDGS